MPQDTLKPGMTDVPPFEDHLKTVAAGIRGAVLDLMASVQADPEKPQDMARRFGLLDLLEKKAYKKLSTATRREKKRADAKRNARKKKS